MKQMLFILMGILLSSLSYADVKVGNGGGAFVCIDQNEQILSAVNQDLWEAQNVTKPPLSIAEKSGTESQGAFEVIQQLEIVNPKFYLYVKEALADILNRREILPLRIKEIGDSNHQFELFQCQSGIARFAQTAIYTTDQRIIYSKSIWEKMPLTDQMALNVHEALYKIFRDYYGEPNSTRTRQVVGILFSNEASLNKLLTLIPALHFNPLGPLSYEGKVKDLWARFKEGSPPLEATLQRLSTEEEARHFFGLWKTKEQIPAPGSWFIFSSAGDIWSNPERKPNEWRNPFFFSKKDHSIRGTIFGQYNLFQRGFGWLSRFIEIPVSPDDLCVSYYGQQFAIIREKDGDLIMAVFPRLGDYMFLNEIIVYPTNQ